VWRGKREKGMGFCWEGLGFKKRERGRDGDSVVEVIFSLMIYG
jgi:hypothetical protein